jgi:hypothetical protein
MAIVEWQLADLSCGDSALVDALSANQHEPWRGDICDIEIGGLDLLGPIEETIDQIPHVDLFILSETLEHLDDPAMVLRKIRAKADRLLMSTPIHSDDMLDANPEHYWQWDYADLKAMLLESGWTADHTVVLGGPAWYYTYFIAGCS